MAVSFYRKVDVRVWGDERFARLSAPTPNAQTLWFYLLTGPHVGPVPGLFNVGRAALAEALGWDETSFMRCFNELEKGDMARADWSARVVFLPNALKHSTPENPNQVKGWVKYLDAIPECRLTNEALRAYAEHLISRDPKFWEPFAERFAERLPKRFRERFRERLVKPFRKQDQDQDQEEEKELTPPHPPSPSEGGAAGPSAPPGRRRPRAERQAAEAAAAVEAASQRAEQDRVDELADLRATTSAPEVAALDELPEAGARAMGTCVSCGCELLGRWLPGGDGKHARALVVPQEPGGPCRAHLTASMRDELLRCIHAPNAWPSTVTVLLREWGASLGLLELVREFVSMEPPARIAAFGPVLDLLESELRPSPTPALRAIAGGASGPRP